MGGMNPAVTGGTWLKTWGESHNGSGEWIEASSSAHVASSEADEA
jgi:hypothetical protein